jgi:asparagine synthase (glutamine-hydrolysing)
MCGLAGYIGKGNTFLDDAQLLKKMHAEIAHRGPDGHGAWSSKKHRTALVHRRLSIIDLSDDGLQPMQDKDGTVIISFNGEIYNYQQLRKELQTLGHRFYTNTDTEVFLLAFKQWGIACLEKLDGMFAAALGNLKTDEWYLVRDRIGIKPLYLSQKGDYFSFASEIKSLWHLPWLEKKVSTRGFYHYLTFMVAPAPWTLFKGIYKLPAGHYAKITADRNISFHQWYNPLVPKTVYSQQELNDEQFCIDQIRDLLRGSIKKRMMSDVPFGVFLSGGIDSSLNVALMAEFTSQVKTFNVSFSDGPEYSEVKWARKVAAEFGTDHHEITISEKEAFQFYEKMVYHQDEPIADCVCIPLYYVSKLLKDSGGTVVQVGEGSDELFCGYQNYANYLETYKKFYQPARLIPQPIKKAGVWCAAQLFPRKKYHLDLLKQWASGQHLFWSGAIAFSEQWKQDIIKLDQQEPDQMVNLIYPEMNQGYDSYNIVDYHLKQLYQQGPQADFYKSMAYLEFKQRLPELLLGRVDKMTMATSVEARVPFLDYRLVEFALQIQTKLKYKDGITKYILKKAAEGILPHDVIYRKKMGFAAPITRWFKQNEQFRLYFTAQLKKSSWQHLKKDSVMQLFDKTQQEGYDYSVPLWVIQNALATGVV